MKTLFAIISCIIVPFFLSGQVRTRFNNTIQISSTGKFKKSFRMKEPHVIRSRNISELLAKEALDQAREPGPFRIAEPVSVDIDIVKNADWVEENGLAFGKYTIHATGAKTISADFDFFFLPKNTELYAYSENGQMITGPVTEKENNVNNFWGTWVYRGEQLTIEVKLPISSKSELKLHLASVAYGYKDIYRPDVHPYLFGNSEPCNINVLCPLGSGWEKERNSVVLILNRGGSAFCSGALINNAANLDIPYVLTANHCFNSIDGDNDPTQWKFTFQAWSPTCSPNQNADGITFNGASLRANSAATDFCLVQMNNSPPASTCITAAGWSRVTNNIEKTTIIHHPIGDVMKISADNQPPVQEVILFKGVNTSTWRLELDQGALQGGSSGAPYFDQNHRIIGQHASTPLSSLPECDRLVKFGGRFDLSWTGGGTSSTRLSDWLDPNNTGAMITDPRVSGLSISGPNFVCNTTAQFLSTGSVTWSSSNPSILAINQTTGLATRPSNLNGLVTISASSSGCNGVSYQPLTITTFVGPPTANSSTLIYPSGQRGIDPVTLCAGCAYTFLVDFVQGASSYTWVLPSGFSFLSGRTTSTPSIRTSTQSGTYTLYCSANNTCGASYTRSLTIIIGGGGGQQQRVAVYPNPTSSSLTIESNGNSLSIADGNQSDKSSKVDDFTAKLLNEFNIVMLWGESKNGKIVFDVSGIPNGIYFLHVIKGGELSSQQIMINR